MAELAVHNNAAWAVPYWQKMKHKLGSHQKLVWLLGLAKYHILRINQKTAIKMQLKQSITTLLHHSLKSPILIILSGLHVTGIYWHVSGASITINFIKGLNFFFSNYALNFCSLKCACAKVCSPAVFALYVHTSSWLMKLSIASNAFYAIRFVLKFGRFSVLNLGCKTYRQTARWSLCPLREQQQNS